MKAYFREFTLEGTPSEIRECLGLDVVNKFVLTIPESSNFNAKEFINELFKKAYYNSKLESLR
jgi:hypothetical protein